MKKEENGIARNVARDVAGKAVHDAAQDVSGKAARNDSSTNMCGDDRLKASKTADETSGGAVCGASNEASDAAASEDKRVFTNAECPYFPCHTLPANTTFNCAFCYCPLYALGPECGGAFRYNEKGYKDCTYCTVMHEGARGFSRVQELFPKLAELARRK